MNTKPFYTAVIADCNKEHMRILAEHINRMGIFKECVFAEDGQTTLKLTSKLKPDLLICSMFLPDIDGLGIAYRVRQSLPNTAIIMSSSVDNDFVTHSSFTNGADMVLVQPCEYNVFSNSINSLLKNRSLLKGSVIKSESFKKRIFTDITREIQHIGISAGIKGFKYVRYAIYIYILSDKIPRVMKDIYPAVAKKFGTTISCVERDIRHALESAWIRGSISYIDEVFGFTVDADKGKPTNSAFIATVAERVKLKNM